MSEDNEQRPDDRQTADSGQAPEADQVSDTGQVPAAQEPPAAPQPERGPAGARSSRVRELGVAAIAVLLYFLLIDAAVETFLSGSPLRWIVAGTVAVYLALSILLWRRLGWSAKFALSILILLGLLASTAWFPQGLSQGVSLLRQPTATVLSAVTALVILTAGILFARLRFVPLTAKSVIAVLALYGAAAFVLGVAESATYPDLFHGGSFWHRLPFWLQGSIAGTFIVVPAAILVQFVEGLVRIRGMPLRSWGLQTLALIVSLSMALAGFAAPADSTRLSHVQQQAAQPPTISVPTPIPQTVTPSSAAVSQLVLTPEELAGMLKAYQKLPQRVDRAPFDVRARAAKLGGNVTTAFTFVRDEIANEIYPGVLRGPGGTLSAQAGNSLDKALLLGTLLAAQKRRVQYAQCTLDEGQAQERIRTMFLPPRPSGSSGTFGETLRAALIGEGIPEPRVRELADAIETSREMLHRAAVQTAEADLETVREAMSRAGLKPKPEFDQTTLLADARVHYWVQVEEGGRWEDLDPSFPKAQPGQRFCSAAQTYAELPPDAYQFITFQVRNEYLEGEGLRSDTVLDKKIATAELHGQAILFTNVPVPPDTKPTESIALLRRLEPVLMVGNLVIPGKRFEVREEAPSGAQGLFGAVLGEGSPRPKLVAQWLDFEVSAPGRSLRESRAIVDAVNPEERAKGAVTTAPDSRLVSLLLVQPYAIAISTGRLNRIQVLEQAYASQDAAALARLFAGGADQQPSVGTQGDSGAPEDIVLLTYALRFALTVDETSSGLWTETYRHTRTIRDQPLIAIADFGLRLSPTGKDIFGGGLSLDLRHNMARVVPETPERVEEAFWRNTHTALVGGAVERHLLAYVAIQPAAASSAELKVLSTSSLFALAQQQGLTLDALSAQDGGRLLREKFGKHGGHRLAGEVADDMAVVLPTGPIQVEGEQRLGMWTISLKTGHVTALLDTGLRGAAQERQQTEERVVWSKDTTRAYERMVASRSRYEMCNYMRAAGQSISCAPQWTRFLFDVRDLTRAIANEMGGAINTVIRCRICIRPLGP